MEVMRAVERTQPALTLAALVAVIRRPTLWSTAVVELLRLARPGWWRRWPPLPVPDQSYLDFRLQTAYGSGATDLPPSDVVAYLEWCRRMRSLGA